MVNSRKDVVFKSYIKPDVEVVSYLTELTGLT